MYLFNIPYTYGWVSYTHSIWIHSFYVVGFWFFFTTVQTPQNLWELLAIQLHGKLKREVVNEYKHSFWLPPLGRQIIWSCFSWLNCSLDINSILFERGRNALSEVRQTSATHSHCSQRTWDFFSTLFFFLHCFGLWLQHSSFWRA